MSAARKKSQKTLEGRVAIVTGAAANLGVGIVEALAAAGASVSSARVVSMPRRSWRSASALTEGVHSRFVTTFATNVTWTT